MSPGLHHIRHSRLRIQGWLTVLESRISMAGLLSELEPGKGHAIMMNIPRPNFHLCLLVPCDFHPTRSLGCAFFSCLVSLTPLSRRAGSKPFFSSSSMFVSSREHSVTRSGITLFDQSSKLCCLHNQNLEHCMFFNLLSYCELWDFFFAHAMVARVSVNFTSPHTWPPKDANSEEHPEAL